MPAELGEEERCELTELPRSGCAHCTGALQRERDAQNLDAAHRQQMIDSGVTLEARYPGRCASCSEPFDVGARIRPAVEVGRWLGPCCA